MADKPQSVDEYIASFPPEVQDILKAVRHTLHEAVPGAEEKISYQIPTLTLGGKAVVYFSGWSKHISVYPVPEVDDELAAQLAPYRAGKGTLQFPLNQPVPHDVIAEVASLLSSSPSGKD